jgi:hypothetical protein
MISGLPYRSEELAETPCEGAFLNSRVWSLVIQSGRAYSTPAPLLFTRAKIIKRQKIDKSNIYIRLEGSEIWRGSGELRPEKRDSRG